MGESEGGVIWARIWVDLGPLFENLQQGSVAAAHRLDAVDYRVGELALSQVLAKTEVGVGKGGVIMLVRVSLRWEV